MSKHIWKKSSLSRETVDVQKKFLDSKLVLKVYVNTSSPVGKIQILYFYQFLFCRLAKNSPLNKINLIKVWIWAVLISRSIAKSFFGLGLGCKIYDLSQNIRIGTIQVLRRWLYKAHPPTYVSMNSTVNQQNCHFLTPPSHLADIILEWSHSKRNNNKHCFHLVATKVTLMWANFNTELVNQGWKLNSITVMTVTAV